MKPLHPLKMPIGLSHAQICAKFDQLVAAGIIAWQPSETVLVADKGMTVRSDRMIQLTASNEF